MSTVTPPVARIVADALANEISQQTKVHLNLGQETIIITEDKVRLCLMDHLKRLEARNAWVAPASVLITIVASFLSSSFRDFVLDASTWRAVFVITAILSAGWLGRAVWHSRKAPTLEDVVATMKHAGRQPVDAELLAKLVALS